MARLLNNKGYKEVRPLLGGIDAWLELGYPVETCGRARVLLAPLASPDPAK